MNIALLGAFGAMICWGVGDFLIQRSTRKIGDIEALVWIGAIGAIILAPFVLKDILSLTGWQQITLLAILGVVTFVAAIFDFEALREGKISVVDMVLTLELPLTILFGILFLDERLTLVQFGLIAVLMWGISMISVSGGRMRFSFERGVWFALAAAVGMALVNFLTAVSAIHISPLMAIWFPWVVFTLLCLVVIARRKHGFTQLASHLREHRGLIILMSLFDTAAWLLFAYALTAGDLGITTAITEGYPVVALMLGVTVGGERLTRRQYAGGAIVVMASVALALML